MTSELSLTVAVREENFAYGGLFLRVDRLEVLYSAGQRRPSLRWRSPCCRNDFSVYWTGMECRRCQTIYQPPSGKSARLILGEGSLPDFLRRAWLQESPPDPLTLEVAVGALEARIMDLSPLVCELVRPVGQTADFTPSPELFEALTTLAGHHSGPLFT